MYSERMAAAPGFPPVNIHHLCLADAVGSRHGLQVILGVPVTVKDDDCVSGGEVDAQPACPGTQQESKVCGAGGIEMFHSLQQHISSLTKPC